MNFGPKQVGRCLCCQTDCFEVLETQTEGPLIGHPKRIGPQLECGTQVEFLMSDGTEASITFCIGCANELRIEHYQDVWEACIERNELSLRLADRKENVIKMATAKVQSIFPIDIRRCRRVHPESDMLIVDRRWNNG